MKEYSAKLIMMANQKGGVGKSTLTFNLAYHLAELGHKVLAIDFDGQGTLSRWSLGQVPTPHQQPSLGQAIQEHLKAEQNPSLKLPAAELPIVAAHNFFICPANSLLPMAERDLVLTGAGLDFMRQLIEPLRQQFDFILLDSPPGMGMLLSIELGLADYVLAVCQTQNESRHALQALLESVVVTQRRSNRKLKLLGVVPSTYDGRLLHEQEVLENLETQFAPQASQVLGYPVQIFPFVPNSSAVKDASANALPLALYASGSRSGGQAVAAFQMIAQRIGESL